MGIFRKPTIPGASSSSEDQARAADQLRAEIAALENELAQSTRVLADIEARAAVAESRAMQAIQAGDDRAARDAIVDQGAYAEKAAAVGADLKVLRAILDECYQFLNVPSASPPPQP